MEFKSKQNKQMEFKCVVGKSMQMENRCSWKIDVDVDVDVEYVDGKSMQNMQIFFNGV